MLDNTAVMQPDGSIIAVDTSLIDDTKADLLAQAVGQMVDGAEAEAAHTLLLLASGLDSEVLGRRIQKVQAENERLRAALEQIAEPMAGSADRETWQDLAELRADIAEVAIDSDKDRYPTTEEWEDATQRAEELKEKHEDLFRRFAEKDDESGEDDRPSRNELAAEVERLRREIRDAIETLSVPASKEARINDTAIILEGALADDGGPKTINMARVDAGYEKVPDPATRRDNDSSEGRRTDDSETLEQQAARQREMIEDLNAEVKRLRSIFRKLEEVCYDSPPQTIHPNHVLQFVGRALGGAGDGADG
jgi:hypothetical protein